MTISLQFLTHLSTDGKEIHFLCVNTVWWYRMCNIIAVWILVVLYSSSGSGSDQDHGPYRVVDCVVPTPRVNAWRQAFYSDFIMKHTCSGPKSSNMQDKELLEMMQLKELSQCGKKKGKPLWFNGPLCDYV